MLKALTTDYHTFYEAYLAALRSSAPVLAQRIADYKYQLLLSNPDPASIRGGLYVCGLKPYARRGQVYAFPDAELSPNYQAYLDEQWRTPYVARALQLIRFVQTELLQQPDDPRRVLLTNWFFQRAEDAAQLRQIGLKTAHGIPYHRQLLDYYQPKIVLCVGNGKAQSAYAGMVELHGAKGRKLYDDPYLDRSRLKALRTAERLIVGVPHLSRYGVDQRMLDWIRELLR